MDIPTWEKLVCEWRYQLDPSNIEGLTQKEILKVQEGLDRLRDEIGEDGITDLKEGNHRLFWWYFASPASWARLFLADLGEILYEFEGSTNLKIVRRRLLGEEFESALAELKVASQFKRSGYHVEFQPKVKRRKADLKVSKSGSEYYVEVTILGPSEEEKLSMSRFNRFMGPLRFRRDVEIGGRILKILSKPRIEEIHRRIEAAANEAKNTQKCIPVYEENVIDLLVCPKGRTDNLQRWLTGKGYTGQFSGPPIKTDDILRLRRKINGESKQLPKDRPGIIVVFADPLFAPTSKEVGRLVNEIEETIYDHERIILGVIRFPGMIDDNDTTYRKEDFTLIRKKEYKSRSINILVIENRYSKFTSSSSSEIIKTLSKINSIE